MNTIYKMLILTSLLILGCKTETKELPVATNSIEEVTHLTISNKQFEASGMHLGTLEKKQFDKVITVNGKINLPHKNKAIVSSMMSGTVGRINLIEGQWVKKGQALFTVTNPDLINLQEEYLVLQSKIDFLREEQLRKEKLVKENLTSKQDLLFAQSEFQTNQAKYNTVGQKLKMYGVEPNGLSIDKLSTSITIFSPISGYVSSINALRGQYIEPSTEVIRLDNSFNVHLELNVLERDGFLINKGQNITFTVAGSTEKIYQAMVHLINPIIDDNGMITVHCHISEPKDLLPGMYASANMILESYEAYAVPEDAIVQIEGASNILIHSSSSNEQMNYLPYEVELGVHKNGFTEILNHNDIHQKEVLVKGGYYLVN